MKDCGCSILYRGTDGKCNVHRVMATKHNKGQALVELALTVVIAVFLVLGIIEFGYDFMALNVITQATASGARAASVLQVGSRGLCGKITDDSSISGDTGIVKKQIGGVATAGSVVVILTQGVNGVMTPTGSAPCPTFTGATIPTVTVEVTGKLPYLFGLLGSTAFTFNRAETFRDEGR